MLNNLMSFFNNFTKESDNTISKETTVTPTLTVIPVTTPTPTPVVVPTTDIIADEESARLRHLGYI